MCSAAARSPASRNCSRGWTERRVSRYPVRPPAAHRESLTEGHARRRAPVVAEPRLEINTGSEIGIPQRAEISQIPADADVLAEEAHHAAAQVVHELVVRE